MYCYLPSNPSLALHIFNKTRCFSVKLGLLTGSKLSISQVLTKEIEHLQVRVDGCLAFKTNDNSTKKVTMV
jgi:hypothetical protein